MTKPFIVIGDQTSHGGKVVAGATTATTHGKQIARVGDKVTCPKCGDNTIATGDDTMIVMGQPAARDGDKTACGATLIAGQTVTSDGQGGGGGNANGPGGRPSKTSPSTAETPSAAAAPGSTAPTQQPSTNGGDTANGAMHTPTQKQYGEPSGPQWVARYPTSTSTSDLAEPFRGNVERFISALKNGGASVTISATYRPPERAYLMHWAWEIAHGADPTTVPTMKGVNIDWAHRDNNGQPNLSAARRAAEQMVHGYDMVHHAALISHHTERRAIDMDIYGYDNKNFLNGSGKLAHVTNASGLYELGRSYGVIKLKTDPPHWSDDGH